MKFTESYVPELSNYIVGMIQHLDDTMVTLFVLGKFGYFCFLSNLYFIFDFFLCIVFLAGNEETKEPKGKFSMALDEELTDANVLNLDRNDIFQAKYVPKLK